MSAPKFPHEKIGNVAPFGLRMLPDLKEKIERSAVANNRSMNAEIVARLEQSFDEKNEFGIDSEVVGNIVNKSVQSVIKELRSGIEFIPSIWDVAASELEASIVKIKSEKPKPEFTNDLAAVDDAIRRIGQIADELKLYTINRGRVAELASSKRIDKPKRLIDVGPDDPATITRESDPRAWNRLQQQKARSKRAIDLKAPEPIEPPVGLDPTKKRMIRLPAKKLQKFAGGED